MIESPVLTLIFLFGSSLLTGTASAIQRMGKTQAESIAKKQKGLAKRLFQKDSRDHVTYALNLSKSLLLICYTITAFDFAFQFLPLEVTARAFVCGALIILGVSMVADTIFRMASLFRPHAFFRYTCQLASIFILPFWPLALLLHRVFRCISPSSKNFTSFRMKDKILEILQDSEFAPHIDSQDQKLILSMVSFKERIAREVMVPRIDMYTLDANTSVQEAAKGFLEEGYSRIPVWKDTMDQIIGALYYKDLLNLYFVSQDNASLLDQPIEKLLKPIVYTPETKKISQLLQEFRNKQIHMAIVVDEYGGTEGIVTIEDILEELVGEIADEYDDDEEALYIVLPSGGWIVDAKMTIIDIEEELGIKIPQNPEYDTIGGFIFHKAGAIPSKGWSFHHDDFDLEVLSSSERTIEKIRITSH